MIETFILSNERFQVLWRSRRPWEKQVAYLRATTGGASGHHLLGPGPNLHDAGPQPWPAPSSGKSEICPRLDRTLLILSIIGLSDAMALLEEKSLDQICGIEPRPW